MTKEALIAFGLTEEQAEKAIQLHNAAMEGYVPKGTYDVLKAENENLVATVNSNKTELEKLKNLKVLMLNLPPKSKNFRARLLRRKLSIKSSSKNYAKLMQLN